MRSTIALSLAAVPAVLAQKCPPLEVVYARATTEPPTGITVQSSAAQFEAAAARVWSKGYGAAGFSLVSNVSALIPGAVGYPVHYPASFGESVPKGTEDMLNHLSERAKACQTTKFVLGGHSQGGGVTVRTIPQIPKDILSKVIAVTMFGSPPCPAVVADRCKSYCNAGDTICEGGGKGGKGKMSGKGKMGGKGGFGGKGFGGKGGKGGAPPAVSDAERATAPALFTDAELARELMAAAPDCAGEFSPDKVEIKGRQAKGSREGPHLLYNKDGYYVKAASCYILSQWKKQGGA